MTAVRGGVARGLLAAAALAVAGPARAQVALEARAGASFGNHVPASSGLGLRPGPSLSALVEARARPGLSLYATAVRAAFPCTKGLCADRDVTVVTRGFGAGATLRGRLPWARVGLLRYDASVRTAGEAFGVGPSLGFEAAGGVRVPLAWRLHLLPGLYFRSQTGNERTTLVGLDVGLRREF